MHIRGKRRTGWQVPLWIEWSSLDRQGGEDMSERPCFYRVCFFLSGPDPFGYVLLANDREFFIMTKKTSLLCDWRDEHASADDRSIGARSAL